MGRARLRTKDLPDFADEIVAQFEEIEACALRGELTDLRGRAKFSGYIDSYFWRVLAWPEEQVAMFDLSKRREWINTCLRRFRARLQAPTFRFEAWRGSTRREVVCLAPEGEVHLRFDQIAYQRMWGIEIFSSDSKHDDAIARYCVREAFAQLRADWQSVNRFCARLPRSEYLQNLCFTEDRLGNRFEQLVLGILNEQTLEAEPVSLYQDACEWTDLILPGHTGLGDKRVQTKFYRDVTQNDTLVSAPATAATIVLSPVEIARYLEQRMTAQGDSAWIEFLQGTGRRICDLQDLCNWTYRLFVELLEAPLPEHPFGVVASVPWILRRAIRSLVESKVREFDASVREALQFH